MTSDYWLWFLPAAVLQPVAFFLGTMCYTDGDAKLMKRNLRLLLDLAGPGRIKVRVPLIPQFNTANDQEKSVAELKAMGIENIEIFDYIIREE